jgi:hypothetical protein
MRESGEEAIRGMRDAQSECHWLHEQLQSALTETGASPSVRAPTSTLAASHHKVPNVGGQSLEATRTAYVRAVQRCHELHVHAARTADAEAALRTELQHACERIAMLHAEVDALRAAQARAASAARVAAIAGGAAAGCAAAGGLTTMADGVAMGGAAEGSVSPPPPPSGLSTLHPGHTRLNAAPSDLVSPPLQQVPSRALRGSKLAEHAGHRVRASSATSGAPSSAAPPASAVRSANSTPAAEVSTLRAELARAHAQIADMESELDRRQAAHQSDLEGRFAAQRDAAASARTLQSERAWVATLDEMRLDDLASIQLLESRLAQWAAPTVSASARAAVRS